MNPFDADSILSARDGAAIIFPNSYPYSPLRNDSPYAEQGMQADVLVNAADCVASATISAVHKDKPAVEPTPVHVEFTF
jgi:hypothetical protein